MRTVYGRCSFDMPPGHVLVQQASRLVAENDEQPVCITLAKREAKVAKEPLISEITGKMNSGGLFFCILLNTFFYCKEEDPATYFRMKAKETAIHFENARTILCEPLILNGYPACRGETRMDMHFPFHQITIVWKTEKEIAVTETMRHADEAGEGWRILQKFAESVRLGEKK
jgi:hypothetical protein